MATGIVSVALRAYGDVSISRVLAVAALALWGMLAGLFALRLLADRARWLREARQPAALTAVAGTAVLGSRATEAGWTWAGWTLLAVAAVLCLTLLPPAMRGLGAPVTGSTFLFVVALQSLAVLSAELAFRRHLEWPALAAMGPFLVGLCLYPLVLSRFPLRGLREESGEHWITGGALAISTLACGELAGDSGAIPGLGASHEPLRVASIVLWALTMAWLPALIVAEVRWPRLRYSARRWATVFPLGMYAAMSFAVSEAAGVDWIGSFARAATWVALVIWAAVTLGALWRLRELLGETH